MTGAESGPGEGLTSDLLAAVAQVLAPDGRVAGTGFLVAEGVLVTCAHVVEAAGGGPGTSAVLSFPHVTGADRVAGTVPAELWRSSDAEDVAFVRLTAAPAGARVLPLGSAEGCRGHEVRSYGFPTQARAEGHYGYGEAGDVLPASEGRGAQLQLTDANDLTTGFSGGPVLDDVTGLVIGMLTEITAPDAYERGLGIAYATPAQVLRDILPGLADQGVCPYRGLEPFTAEHARWFQGRSDAVEQVVANLRRQRRLTLLLGPSGSGKSSLIQAGVLRELAKGGLPGSDRWLPVLARPRQDMLGELEQAGLPGARRDGIIAAVNRRLAAEPSYHRILLVIDQFEELLVQSTNGRLRDTLAVIDEVTSSADWYTKITVILIMRDDFYPQLAARAPRLLDAAMPGLLNVPGTLSQDDLHDIIVEPAADVGLRFQPGLPERITSDVLEITPEAADRHQAPVTVLPLLEMTLQQLWEQRQDGYLTHDAYGRIGGVSGSLTTWCDSTLEELSPAQRAIARRALTSLVHPADPGRNINPVRTQVPLDELRDLAADPGHSEDQGDVDAVIVTLARRRIITTQKLEAPERAGAPHGEPVAELIHEALIRDWGALRDWVDDDHRFQDWLRRTREREARWVAANKHPGDLLAGSALGEALELSGGRRLPSDIEEFLTASQERQRAGVRRSRRVIAVLAGLLALALIAVVGVIWQWQRVGHAKDRSLSRELAAQSNELLYTDPELAALLAVKAYRTKDTPEAVDTVRSASALPAHRRLSGHDSPVRAVAYAEDGSILASAGDDHIVLLRDAKTLKIRFRLTHHRQPVNAVAFSKDERLATGSDDGTVRLWDPDAGELLRTLSGHTGPVRAVAFSKDGQILATGSDDNTVRLWNPDTGEPLGTLKGHTKPVRAVAFHPDGNTFATGSDDTTVRLWNLETRRSYKTLDEHLLPVTSVAFSPDGNMLATADDAYVYLRDPRSGEEHSPLYESASLIAFSPDGKSFVTATDRYVRLWDTDTKGPRGTLIGHYDDVLALAFSRDNRTLATASRDTTVRLWNASLGKDNTTLRGHTGTVYKVAYSRDGDKVATASADETAQLWDPDTGERLRELKLGGEVNVAAFHPDGHTVATASDDWTVRLWDADADTTQERAKLEEHQNLVRSAAFSPDGRILATADEDGTVYLRDAHTGAVLIDPLATHSGPIYDVAFSPDSRVLATAGDDSTTTLWDVASGRKINTLRGHHDAVFSVAFSPDGRRVATGSLDGTVRLWDADRGRPLIEMTKHRAAVETVAFHPDGAILATGSDDGTVRLWDANSGKARVAVLASFSGVNSLAFSPDGRALATAGDDGTARLWRIDDIPEADEALRQVCRTFSRDLTALEQKAYVPGDSDASVCP
ncbi:WD40 repeat protein/energy-coupling factor transporter ATP-binding protein EcfA2 [Streptomyces sp. SAI-170]|uniref:nSTAND1 domain-containing NTPase n=1 Tax=Streptomyces sp. SAI-170 TaxID=3377729 RepID=UPI003C798718